VKLSEITRQSLEDVSKEELLNLHRRCHQLWALEGQDRELLREKHDLIVQEMLDRGLRHRSPLEEEKEVDLPGLYLVEPHALWIAEGKKKAILKSRPIIKPGQRYYLLSEDFAYGVIVCGEPEIVTREEALKLQDDHLLSEREMDEWWPEAEKLYYYPVISFAAFPEPREWKRPQGAQTLVSNVQFKAMGEQLAEDLKGIPGFVWIPGFVSISGSCVYLEGGRSPNDMDLILRAEWDQERRKFIIELDDAFAIKLVRALEAQLGQPLNIEWHSGVYGPNWPYIELYDLYLKPRAEPSMVTLDEEEFAEALYKERQDRSRWIGDALGRLLDLLRASKGEEGDEP